MSRPNVTSIALALLLLLGIAHARTPSPVRLLALGDSFTIGTGGPPSLSFPERLASRWRSTGHAVTVLNLARNGYTTDNLIDEELPRAKAFAPTLVTLAIGANDIVQGRDGEAYRERVRRIFAGLASAGIAARAIVVLPQPAWWRSPTAAAFGSPADFRARIARCNDVLREETMHVGARWMDLSPIMEREAAAQQLADDGLHPSAIAYDEWAAELARALLD